MSGPSICTFYIFTFKSFWTNQNCYGPDQKQLFATEFRNLTHVQNILDYANQNAKTGPKKFGLNSPFLESTLAKKTNANKTK